EIGEIDLPRAHRSKAAKQQQPPDAQIAIGGIDAERPKALEALLTVADDLSMPPRDQETGRARILSAEHVEQILLREAKPVPAEMLLNERHQIRQINRGYWADRHAIVALTLAFKHLNFFGNLKAAQVNTHADGVIDDLEPLQRQKFECSRVSLDVH